MAEIPVEKIKENCNVVWIPNEENKDIYRFLVKGRKGLVDEFSEGPFCVVKIVKRRKNDEDSNCAILKKGEKFLTNKDSKDRALFNLALLNLA